MPNTRTSEAENIRAAQYVRMSTDHQRYSIENQAAAIAAYAAKRNLILVAAASELMAERRFKA